VNFYFPPGITNVAPFTGRAGTNVVIKGTNFLNASKVLFGSVNAAYVTNSLTQITAIVPVGAISGPVRVVTPGGQYITSSNFIVLPDISSISPIAGNENSVVTINGSNLTVGGNPTVSFNGLLATLFGTPTSSQIFARAPIGGSSGPITVQTSEGTAISPTNFYYPPVISGLFPTNGPSGTTVTISGKNFTNASAVVFSANSATNFTVVDNTMITAVVPPGEVTGAISVTTPGGTTASLQTFFGTPIIKTFSPQAGVAGVPVTITGTNLSNVKKVLFNGTAAQTATNVNESVIVANVPLGATTGLITVQNFGGSVNSATAFIIDPLLLSITNLNSNIVAISWTTNAVGYSLQFTTNLLTTNNTWSNEPVSVQIIGGKNTVTNSATNAQKIYRLRN
jgi:hypothetical protein